MLLTTCLAGGLGKAKFKIKYDESQPVRGTKFIASIGDPKHVIMMAGLVSQPNSINTMWQSLKKQQGAAAWFSG